MKYLNKRDHDLLISLGKFKFLTLSQIIKLHFQKNYYTDKPLTPQSRYRIALRRLKRMRELKLIKEPSYYFVKQTGEKTPVYHLDIEGKKIAAGYLDVTIQSLNIKEQSDKVPHYLNVNELLINLNIDNFELEKKFGNIRSDAKFLYKNEYYLLEEDNSNYPDKRIHQEKIMKYEKFYLSEKYKNYFEVFPKIIFRTNHIELLKRWTQEITQTNIPYIFKKTFKAF